MKKSLGWRPALLLFLLHFCTVDGFPQETGFSPSGTARGESPSPGRNGLIAGAVLGIACGAAYLWHRRRKRWGVFYGTGRNQQNFYSASAPGGDEMKRYFTGGGAKGGW